MMAVGDSDQPAGAPIEIFRGKVEERRNVRGEKWIQKGDGSSSDSSNSQR